MTEQCFRAITVIEAERALIAMKIADYPKLSRGKREEFHRSMMDLANPIKKYRDIRDVIKRFNGG